MLGHNKLYSIQDDEGIINVIWKCIDCSEYGRIDNVAAYSITTAPTCTAYGWARLTYTDNTTETVKLNVAHNLNGVAMIEADDNNRTNCKIYCKICKNQVEKIVNTTEHQKAYSLYNKNGSTYAAWRCLNNFCLENGTEKIKSVEDITPATCVSYGFANVEFENGTVEKIKLDINYSAHRLHGKYIINGEENKVFYDYGTDGINVFHNITIETCNEDILGMDGYIHCDDCNKSYTIFVRKPHSLVTIEGVAPTDTKTGLTEGVKCSVCGKIYIQQEVIPALNNYRNANPSDECGSIESFNGVSAAINARRKLKGIHRNIENKLFCKYVDYRRSFLDY